MRMIILQIDVFLFIDNCKKRDLPYPCVATVTFLVACSNRKHLYSLPFDRRENKRGNASAWQRYCQRRVDALIRHAHYCALKTID